MKKAKEKVQKHQNSVEGCQSDFKWTKAVVKYDKGNQEKIEIALQNAGAKETDWKSSSRPDKSWCCCEFLMTLCHMTHFVHLEILRLPLCKTNPQLQWLLDFKLYNPKLKTIGWLNNEANTPSLAPNLNIKPSNLSLES